MKIDDLTVRKIEKTTEFAEYLEAHPYLTRFSGFAMFASDMTAFVAELLGDAIDNLWQEIDFYAALEAFASDNDFELDGDRDVDDVAAEFCHLDFNYFRIICKQFDLKPADFKRFAV